MSMYCKHLLGADRELLHTLCEGGSPLPIPDGQHDPRTTFGDLWRVRLADFDGGMPGGVRWAERRRGGVRQKPVGIWLLVDQAEFLDHEPAWQGPADENGYRESVNPWSMRLVFATACLPQRELDSALRSCGVESMPEGYEARRRFVEEVAIDYGFYCPVFEGYVADADFDAGVGEALVQAQSVCMMPGAYLDRVVNRIGSTGWEFMRGDVGSAMKRLGGG